MSVDRRLDALERSLGGGDAPLPAAIVPYGIADVPADPAERDAWLDALRPPGPGAVYCVPDNGRGRPHYPPEAHHEL